MKTIISLYHSQAMSHKAFVTLDALDVTIRLQPVCECTQQNPPVQ